MITDQIAEEHPSPQRAQRESADIAAVRSGVTDLEQQARALIKQRPIAAVLAAVGAGYLVARVLSRVTR